MAVRTRSTLKTSPSSPFVLPPSSSTYTAQYAHLYFLRLFSLRPLCLARANAKWGNIDLAQKGEKARHCEKVLDVEMGKLCWVVGTVYVDMALKPNVLADLARDHHIAAPPARVKYHSSSDELMLEDESGRVRLVGEYVNKHLHEFVTGTIAAVLGVETSNGDFEVLEVVWAGPLPPSSSTPEKEDGKDGKDGKGKAKEEEGQEQEEDSWLAIVSGLGMGASTSAPDLRTSLLSDWLTGQLSSDDGQGQGQDEVKNIVALVIAGDSLATPRSTPLEDPGDDASSNKKTTAVKYGYDSSTYSSAPTTQLDDLLSSLLPSLPVFLLPGSSDPVGPFLPQQPLHHALLPQAGEYARFQRVTNPWLGEIPGVKGGKVLGTSGQNLDDVFKYLEGEDEARVKMAGKMLEWCHIAPTCPDTLWCYPFTDTDPFLLSSSPSLFFIGNQPSFASLFVPSSSSAPSSSDKTKESDKKKKKKQEEEGTRVVLVPRFEERGEVVCVNTRTWGTRVVAFEA